MAAANRQLPCHYRHRIRLGELWPVVWVVVERFRATIGAHVGPADYDYSYRPLQQNGFGKTVYRLAHSVIRQIHLNEKQTVVSISPPVVMAIYLN